VLIQHTRIHRAARVTARGSIGESFLSRV